MSERSQQVLHPSQDREHGREQLSDLALCDEWRQNPGTGSLVASVTNTDWPQVWKGYVLHSDFRKTLDKNGGPLLHRRERKCVLISTVGLDIPSHGAITCALADWLLVGFFLTF